MDERTTQNVAPTTKDVEGDDALFAKNKTIKNKSETEIRVFETETETEIRVFETETEIPRASRAATSTTTATTGPATTARACASATTATQVTVFEEHDLRAPIGSERNQSARSLEERQIQERCEKHHSTPAEKVAKGVGQTND